MSGPDLTILVALAAGLLSFLSPCVLPLVPAYLGQLTAIAVAAGGAGRPAVALDGRPARRSPTSPGSGPSSRSSASPRRSRPARSSTTSPPLRIVGGVAADRPGPQPRRDPPHPGPRADVAAARRRRVGLAGDGDRHGGPRARATRSATPASATGSAPGSSARAAAGSRRSGSARSSRSAGRRASASSSAAILTMAATSGTTAQGAILLVAYTLGLGLPFIVIALVYDRAPRLVRPLVRHGQTVVAHRRAAGRRSSASRWSSTGSRCCRATSRSTRPSEVSERPEFTAPARAARAHRPVQRPADPRRVPRDRGRRDRPRRDHDAARHDRRPGPRRSAGHAVRHRLADAGPAPRRPRARARGHARRRHDLPAHGPRRAARPARRPARQGGLAQLLGELVPAVPGRDADPARAVGALQGPGPRGDRGQRPGDDRRRRRGVRRPLRPATTRSASTPRRRLPRVQGLRAADPVLHRHERRHPAGRQRPGRRGRRGGADRIDAAAGVERDAVASPSPSPS